MKRSSKGVRLFCVGTEFGGIMDSPPLFQKITCVGGEKTGGDWNTPFTNTVLKKNAN